jgi:uncharacterized protein HemX
MLPFILSVGNVLPGLFGKKLSDRAAKITGIALLVALAVAVLSVGKCAYDASVVNRYEQQHEAEAAKKQLQADRDADKAVANQAAELADTQKKLDEATREAAQRDPEGAAKTVGPVTESYYETLRKKEKRK